MNRTFGAALLFGVAGAGLLFAFWFVSLTWSESADYSDSFYLETAAIPFVIGVASGLAGWWTLRH